MLGREARVQPTFGRPGCSLWIGFVRARGRSRLPEEAAAESVELRSLREIAVAIFVSLGILTAASANTDDNAGCANASDLKGALAACTKIIESNWANDHQVALAFNNRANANDALGYSDAAINDYARALAMDPHYGNALYNRGSTYLELGELDLAIADLNAVLKIDARRAEAYNNRGIAFLQLGDTATAIADFMALEMNPSLASAHNNLGLARREISDYAQAITEFSRAIELMPNYVAALNHRGETLMIEHRYAEALRDFSGAFAIDPEYAAAARNPAIANELVSVDGDPPTIQAHRTKGTGFGALGTEHGIPASHDGMQTNAKAFRERGVARDAQARRPRNVVVWPKITITEGRGYVGCR